jgi:hypothetical protein
MPPENREPGRKEQAAMSFGGLWQISRGKWHRLQRFPACGFPHDRSSTFVVFFVKLTARMLPGFSQLQANFADSHLLPEPVGGKLSLSSRDFSTFSGLMPAARSASRLPC